MGFANTFKALSDPVRREILVMLKEGRMTAGDIGNRFDMTGASISYHLSQLKKAGLIFETRQKNYIIYELNASVFEEAMLWLAQFKEGKSNAHEKKRRNNGTVIDRLPFTDNPVIDGVR